VFVFERENKTETQVLQNASYIRERAEQTVISENGGVFFCPQAS